MVLHQEFRVILQSKNNIKKRSLKIYCFLKIKEYSFVKWTGQASAGQRSQRENKILVEKYYKKRKKCLKLIKFEKNI
jgi:hypothetical protein